MKKIIFFGVTLVVVACGNKNTGDNDEVYVFPKVDTTAIDSFGPGATSVNVEEQIRKSSKAYQDSLKAVLERQKAEAKKKKAEDSIKAIELKKLKEQKEKEAAETSVTTAE